MGRTQLWVAALLLFLQQLGRSLCHSQVYTVLLDDEPVITKFGRGPPDGKMVEKLRELDAKNYADYLTNKHDFFLEQTLEPASFEKLYSYTHVINGFSVKLNDAQVKLITKVKGVQSVYKSRRARLDTTHTPTFLRLNGGAWQDVGGEDDAGEGVVIGVVDTGIDCSHPSFQNNGASKPYSLTLPHFYGHCDVGPKFPKGSCNGKIIGARFFNKAAKALGRFNASQDFESPFDQDGHGTHTSSTAAGNSNVPVILNDVYFGNASGMAPRARIAVYRCLYSEAQEEADVVAAIEQAVQDGVDILSISLNFDADDDNTTSFLNPFYVALLHASKAGIFTANSAGNNGPRPSSMRANAPWVMTVGATTTDRVYPEGLILGNNLTMTAPTFSPGTSEENMYPIIAAEHALIKEADDDSHTGFPCEKSANYNKSLVEGKIVLCVIPNQESIYPEVNNSVLMMVARTARELGAVGLIWDISNASDSGMELYFVNMPAFVLNFNVENLQAFYDYLGSSENPVGRIFDNLKGECTSRAPKVTSFSARGPAYANYLTEEPINLLKPNIIAPGKDIWAAYSLAAPFETGPEFFGQRFALLSGTSMAAPHVAGIAALIKQKHPTWSPSAIASALSTTATTHDNRRMPIANDGSLEHPHANPFDYGSGFVNAKNSFDPGFVFDAGFEDYIEFACSTPSVDNFEVYRATGIRCQLPRKNSADLNMPSLVVTSAKKNMKIRRKVTSVTQVEEMYIANVRYHHHVNLTYVAITPQKFTLKPNSSLEILIEVLIPSQTISSLHHQRFQFGNIVFRGNQGHSPRIPFAISLAQ